MIYIGNRKKPVEMALPDEIPELDEEQIAAGYAMWRDGHKLLFSDPGAGKTLTALDGMMRVDDQAFDNGDDIPLCLVICPSIAIRTWAIWIAKVYQETGYDDDEYVIQILTGNSDKIRDDATHLIVTYGSLSRKDAKLANALILWKTDILICDESHYLNGGSSNRTEAVFGIGMIAAQATWRWYLTGTPVPRYLDGLWPVLSNSFTKRLADFGIASERHYLQEFCVVKPVKYGAMRYAKNQVVGSRNMKKMNALLYGGQHSIAIRNKLKIRSTPIFSEITVALKPSAELIELQKKALEKPAEMEVDAFGNPVKVVDPEVAAALHMYGQELAPLAADVVTAELQQVGDGILVLFWHREVGKILMKNFSEAGVSAVKIDGASSQNARMEAEDKFNAGEVDILCGQIASMGVALNLQENCHTVIFVEDTYSDAANQQAYQRVWRRGQRYNVNVKYVKTLQPLADLRPKVAENKRKQAREAID